MLYTYSIFVYFMSMSKLNQWSSIICRFSDYQIFCLFCIYVQEFILIPAFFLLFMTFANLVEGLFYSSLLCNISVLCICLVLFDVHILTDNDCHDDAPMEVLAMTTW